MIKLCNQWVRAGALTAVIVAGLASLLFSLFLIFVVFPRAGQIGTGLQEGIGLVENELNKGEQAVKLVGQVPLAAPQGKVVAPNESSKNPLPSETIAGPNISLPVIISEVLAYGSGATDEFVELFNPNNTPVDLSGWQLKKKTASGSEYTLVTNKKFTGIIPAQGYFLISHPDVQAKYKPDLVWSSPGYSIAEGNIVILFDANGNIMSSVDTSGVINNKSASLRSPGLPEFIVSEPSPHNSSFMSGFETPVSVIPPSSQSTVTPSPLPSAGVFISPTPAMAVVAFPSSVPVISLPPIPSESPIPSPEFSPSPGPTPLLIHPVIAQVQYGIEGSASADFIQLYNNSGNPIDLTDYKLVKKTAGSGNEYSIKSWKNDSITIPGQAYFYWVNSAYTDKINELTAQGILFFTTTVTITETNGVALKYQDIVVDSVGW